MACRTRLILGPFHPVSDRDLSFGRIPGGGHFQIGIEVVGHRAHDVKERVASAEVEFDHAVPLRRFLQDATKYVHVEHCVKRVPKGPVHLARHEGTQHRREQCA
jgi:hypothetical protein